MGFSVRFFVALGVACVIRMTWAAECSVAPQNCGSGQYNARNCHTGGLHQVLGYSCVACPDGYPESDVGTPQTINDCYKLENCKYYFGGQVADGEDYHVENNTCYSNTRACRDFSNRVETNGTTSMSCNPEMQQGNAVWQQNAWYTEGCECKRDNVENTGLLRCERVNARAYVKSSNAQVTLSVNDDIIYTLEYMYCAKCHPGYLPNIVTGQNANYLHPSNTNSDWGVLTCATVVSAPDYAPGCVIDFNLPTDDMMAECRKTCPTGFATEAPGTTNVEDCQYDGHTTYTDETGTFYIGSLDYCP